MEVACWCAFGFLLVAGSVCFFFVSRFLCFEFCFDCVVLCFLCFDFGFDSWFCFESDFDFGFCVGCALCFRFGLVVEGCRSFSSLSSSWDSWSMSSSTSSILAIHLHQPVTTRPAKLPTSKKYPPKRTNKQPTETAPPTNVVDTRPDDKDTHDNVTDDLTDKQTKSSDEIDVDIDQESQDDVKEEQKRQPGNNQSKSETERTA